MTMLAPVLAALVIDGFRNNLDNSSIPTEALMQTGLKEIDGFIVPINSVSDAKAFYELSIKTGKPIYGWRIIPQKDKDPRVSIQQAIGFLKAKEMLTKNQTVFIDARKMFFGDDCTKNNRFVVEMYDELQMHLGGPQRIGVMTKKALWTEQMCNMKWDHIKLWYVNHNKKPTFGDYTMFGGWKTPFVKQFDQVKVKTEEVDYTYNVNFM
ncbi:Lysozyme_family protein [Hexamita inflata]|uniref:Lysozyme family protein n=1 Tax=Hexamita inflata TaxID=28002 RepID=A0AA86NV50_9EUKA|nr:Lysozyme family protein [Hexamita inflata]CAI9925635.1 Lysozyme family protein [Hexamita inflata]